MNCNLSCAEWISEGESFGSFRKNKWKFFAVWDRRHQSRQCDGPKALYFYFATWGIKFLFYFPEIKILDDLLFRNPFIINPGSVPDKLPIAFMEFIYDSTANSVLLFETISLINDTTASNKMCWDRHAALIDFL